MTDTNSHCVFVFTDGKYVTLFCQKGQEERDFIRRYYINVDSNGFTYMCDSSMYPPLCDAIGLSNY